MTEPERVVFDCNVYFQALISPTGPAGEALLAVHAGRLVLYTSGVILAELRDVCSRPALAARFQLSAERLEEYVDHIASLATLLEDVVHVFDYERDTNDEHYIDLAVAASASLIVSRDKDLLALQDLGNPDGRRFQQSFPGIDILTPVELLKRLREAN